MKNIFLLFSLIVLFGMYSNAVSQNMDSFKKYDVNVNLYTSLEAVNRFIMFRWNQQKPKTFAAYRFKAGGRFHSNFSSGLPVSGNITDSFFAIGREWYKEKNRSSRLSYGLDFFYFSSLTKTLPTPTISRIYIEKDITYRIGPAPFLGFRYMLSSHFSLSVETSVQLFFGRRVQKGLPLINGVQPPDQYLNFFNATLAHISAFQFAYHW